MREIIFRGKRVDNGEWVCGYYIKANHHWNERGIHEDWIVTSASQNGGWFVVNGRYAVIPETVGQYTNVTINGKKVFDGDILKVKVGAYYNYDTDDFDQEGVYITSVECKEGVHLVDVIDQDFGCTALSWLQDCYSDDCEYEIIGNIHDNPELLKGGDSDA